MIKEQDSTLIQFLF